MKTYAVVYFGAALIAMILTPILSRIAKARGIVDAPGVRKVHNKPIPRIGGPAIMAGMFGLTLPVLLLNNVIGSAFRQIQPKVVALLAASLVMCLTGLIDDLRGLRARVKLAVQVLAALTVCAFGIRIEEIGSEGWVAVKFGWLSWPMTVIWIVGITNAVNLIDGLDGLAAGIAAMACGVIAIFAIWSGQAVMAVLTLALLGSLTGFLFFNFNPAKVFMGDGGTYFVGFLIATASVMCAQKKAALVGLALPVLALGVPILDMLFSIFRRVLERRSIMSADRGHIHHRLLGMGLRQRHAVLIIYLVTVLTAGIGVCMLVADRAAPLLAVLGIGILLAVFRLVGAVRLRESIKIMQRNLANARMARKDRHRFENVQLMMREARSFDAWWQAVCTMAKDMGFEQVAL
ncbi:MAG: glycosyltransferase family 4 protein, partial [Planctomycetota bacterium]